ncbi:HpcH/HpaI aldolase family protein [Arthrobacter sp. B6]|uniref:HpcH/HpaI aldolase family protein n=1 Tax=Arthrobacter sp. B6 TaxID=1570137 RepID=UPI000832BF8C|nr:aldolase/citrate lyase family protein [Arthrobacter sp. B6]
MSQSPPSAAQERTFREAFRSLGKRHAPPAQGAFVTTPDPAFTLINGYAGLDFVVIDNEHSPLSPAEVAPHVIAAQAAGILALVRVGVNDAARIQSFLDLGVSGVVVPKIESAEEVRAGVAATRYPPGGQRGMFPQGYAASFGWTGWHIYKQRMRDGAVVIPIVETVAGLDRLDEIVAEDGVDAVFLGAGDLSEDMGVDIMDSRVGEAYEAALTSCRKAGKLIVGTEYFGRDADFMMHQPERSAYATLIGDAVKRVRTARQEGTL